MSSVLITRNSQKKNMTLRANLQRINELLLHVFLIQQRPSIEMLMLNYCLSSVWKFGLKLNEITQIGILRF